MDNNMPIDNNQSGSAAPGGAGNPQGPPPPAQPQPVPPPVNQALEAEMARVLSEALARVNAGALPGPSNPPPPNWVAVAPRLLELLASIQSTQRVSGDSRSTTANRH
jgi:hypothetical protein